MFNNVQLGKNLLSKRRFYVFIMVVNNSSKKCLWQGETGIIIIMWMWGSKFMGAASLSQASEQCETVFIVEWTGDLDDYI